ncbi:MAG TPA: DUF350 domain-containing protein [Spirochaetota bacterium]|nr:DUF350 domain-containing protein [Spirochaetota bacterium]HQO04327.1 DUF350 domain-containing protein [Spirochaetota bacterium]HQP48826.1 DUF350 domain-containing protein [Spirochaetota bacterium]
MSTQLDVFIYGLVYVLVSLVFGTMTLFLVLKGFNALTRGIDDMKEIRLNNVAVSLVNAAIVFSVALFVSEAVEAAMEAFKNNIFLFAGQTALVYKLKIYGIMLAHLVLAACISFLVLWLSIQIFIHLTRSIDEFTEIGKNNQAVGIFLAVFIISMALILKPGVGKLLKGIVPFPQVTGTPRVSLVENRNFFERCTIIAPLHNTLKKNS